LTQTRPSPHLEKEMGSADERDNQVECAAGSGLLGCFMHSFQGRLCLAGRRVATGLLRFSITHPKSGGKEPPQSKASGGRDLRTDFGQTV